MLSSSTATPWKWDQSHNNPEQRVAPYWRTSLTGKQHDRKQQKVNQPEQRLVAIYWYCYGSHTHTHANKHSYTRSQQGNSGLAEHSSGAATAQNRRKTTPPTVLKLFRTNYLENKPESILSVLQYICPTMTLLLNEDPSLTPQICLTWSFSSRTGLWLWTTSTWSPWAEVPAFLFIQTSLTTSLIQCRRHWRWTSYTTVWLQEWTASPNTLSPRSSGVFNELQQNKKE